MVHWRTGSADFASIERHDLDARRLRGSVEARGHVPVEIEDLGLKTTAAVTERFIDFEYRANKSLRDVRRSPATIAKQNKTPSAELFFTQVQNQVGVILVHLGRDHKRPPHAGLVVRENHLALEPQ